MMYVVRSGDVYVSVEPILDTSEMSPNCSGLTFVWTYERASAAHFTTRWQAHAIARRLRRQGKAGTVVRVPR